MTSNYETPSNSNDRDIQGFACFCEKTFTTYPGLYLHVKSKHSNVFLKYKKLKITKLLKKAKDQNGNDLHQLQNIHQKDNSSRQRKNKQKKRLAEQQEKKASLNEQARIEKAKKSSLNEPKVAKQQQPEKPIPQQKIERQNPKDSYFKMGSPNFPFPFSNPYFGFPYGHPPPIPPFFPHPSFFPNLFPSAQQSQKSQATIKICLQNYLIQCQDVSIQIQLKQTLHDLMVFIDRNSQSFQVPQFKSKERIILSHSDWLKPQAVLHLIASFINRQRQLGYGSEQQKQKRLRRVSYIFKFANWLKETGEIKQPLSKQHFDAQIPLKKPLLQSGSILLNVVVSTDNPEKVGEAQK